jgi:para-nitrobenzyl esterase
MTQLIVATSVGSVRGCLHRGVRVFRGVPFGRSTAGQRRFRPPVPPLPWSGVRDATEFGPAFVQVDADPDLLKGFGATPPIRTSEDALVLNVWTPPADDGWLRPVLVYIHGGGYFSGSGFAFPAYDGSALVRRGDVVVVTFNYRLGVFGFAHLADLAGPAFAHSGNAAVLDQVAALGWVRDNIVAFGGDPQNVTVFGSSAGGHAATALLGVPAARGLFHRIIAQSGHAVCCRTRAHASGVAQALLDELGLRAGSAEELRATPVARLLAAQRAVAARFRGDPTHLVGPLVDGDVLPQAPLEAVAGGVASDVPLLLGVNGDDELGCQQGMAEFATRRLSGAVAPTFMYRFTWATTAIDGVPRSCHGLEVPFVFDNVDCPITGQARERGQLAARMSGAWVAFARHGDPNHAGLPKWPPYSTVDSATMVFDVECRVERKLRQSTHPCDGPLSTVCQVRKVSNH